MRRSAASAIVAFALVVSPLVDCVAEGGDGEVSEQTDPRNLVREPVVAGTFYPGESEELASTVDLLLDAAGPQDVSGDIVALIAPHAGYVYSGGVAAHAYAAVRGQEYDTVIVVAPSHRVAFRGASVFDGSSYETPLGRVSVDREVVDALRGLGLGFDPRAHAQEHSLEVQVPFLQRSLEPFTIVPIVMGEQSEASVRTLGAAIARVVSDRSDSRFLLVASTDLSHYHSQKEASALDAVAVESVEAFDPEELLRALSRGECEACGGGPTAAVLVAARELGADRADVLKYATSGDVTGDMSQVVGYMAAVVTAPADAGTSEGEPTKTSTDASGGGRVSIAERRELLRLARASIESALTGSEPPEAALESDVFETPSGAFVTLHDSGRLRGCIGSIRSARPLAETVVSMAVEAALRDPRFPPVTSDELPALDIEISVMSPIEPVLDVSTIEVGRDGLIIQHGAHSGLLLPQVATEYGWDRETFLDHTCQKAGLPAGTWREQGVTILRFSAEVFGEKEMEGASEMRS